MFVKSPMTHHGRLYKHTYTDQDRRGPFKPLKQPCSQFTLMERFFYKLVKIRTKNQPAFQ